MAFVIVRAGSSCGDAAAAKRVADMAAGLSTGDGFSGFVEPFPSCLFPASLLRDCGGSVSTLYYCIIGANRTICTVRQNLPPLLVPLLPCPSLFLLCRRFRFRTRFQNSSPPIFMWNKIVGVGTVHAAEPGTDSRVEVK